MKKVLFINSGFDIGGIETMLTRAAKRLSGVTNYTILLMSDSVNQKLLDEVKKYANVIFLKDILKFKITNYAIIRTILPLNSKKVKLLLDDIDIIHASCSFSVVLMRRLSQLSGKNILESAGIYHSREFLWGNESSYMRKKQLGIFSELSEKNVLFMNEYTCRLYSSKFHKDYCIALPIGIELDRYEKNEPDFNSHRIISIGRLVDFKSYNKQMIYTLASLKKVLPREIAFEIYGDGPEMDELKSLSNELGVNVIFHGKLEYELMPSVLNGAFVFIGCGTAIIEAAAAGVPSIIGIESIDTPVTYGFLTQTSGLSFHEKGLDLEKIPYEKILNDLFSMNNDEFKTLSLEHRQRAEHFSLKRMESVLISYYFGLNPTNKSTHKVNFFYFLSTTLWLLKNKLGLNHERKKMYDLP